MTNPYRAALVRLMNTIHDLRLEGGNAELKVALNTARALLAQPVAEGPTDEELDELLTELNQGGECLSWRAYARAVLARWGRPAAAAAPVPVLPDDALIIEPAEHTLLVPVAHPVPVSERWPEFSDCDDAERVWCWSWALETWRLSRIKQSIHTHWLPANALPTPEAKP